VARTGAALAGALLLACAGDGGALPDVVLVTLDTTRADHLGAYGYPRPVSPRIDAFAADAMRFARAWSTAPWTLPAHASMFTGRYPTSHGADFDLRAGDHHLGEVLEREDAAEFRVDRLGDEQLTLAELLRERGYATAAFVGGPWLAPPFGLLQGYDVADAELHSLEEPSSAALTERASAWLRSVPRHRPVHLLVNYFDAHAPYQPPAGYRELARGASAGPPPTPGSREALLESYDGEIRFVDEQVGRLLDALRATGRYDRALIAVVGDHGEMFGEHGLFMHDGAHYETLLRVPLFVRLPGGERSGSVATQPFSVVDLLPLVASEVGLALPRGVQGLPLGERRAVFAESRRHGVATARLGAGDDRDRATLIRWPWKLSVTDRGERQLFRLDRDPGEAHDLAGRSPEEEPLAAELQEARRALAPPRAGEDPAAVSPELRSRLRDLGYVD
jgi:arylsulfatase A-like enzyme